MAQRNSDKSIERLTQQYVKQLALITIRQEFKEFDPDNDDIDAISAYCENAIEELVMGLLNATASGYFEGANGQSDDDDETKAEETQTRKRRAA